MPVESDDFFTPINEEPEDMIPIDDDDKSVLSKKKSKKKKKKKKAALLSAIGEDLLDSPVQSQGNASSPRGAEIDETAGKAAVVETPDQPDAAQNDDGFFDNSPEDAADAQPATGEEPFDNNNGDADNIEEANHASDGDDGDFF